jgi:hypothetical protein
MTETWTTSSIDESKFNSPKTMIELPDPCVKDEEGNYVYIVIDDKS